MKNERMMLIIKEMDFNGSNKYEINGIDLTAASFFIRKNRELFRIVAPGDFTILNEGGNTYLVLNTAILTDIISIQVCYEINSISGKYETGSEPDINILVSHYNKLVEDMKTLWGFVQNQAFVSDTLDMTLILPVLSEGETWVYKDGEMKAVLLYDAEEELKKAVEQVRQEITAELQGKIDQFNSQINNLITEFRAEILNTINTGKSEINSIIESFKTDWSALVADSKTEILNFTNDQKTEITNTANTQITNITNVINVGKTGIINLTEEKKEEVRQVAEQIAGFDPTDFYTRSEIDSMLSDVGETLETVFEGNIPLFDGDFVNCTVPGILENANKGTLVITVGDVQSDWFVLTFPVLALSETEYYGFFVPADIYQGHILLLIKTIKQGNDMYFTSINYTGISEISIKKIRHIK